MALTARDLKNDDTTDAGFDLVMDPISSPAGDVGVTKIMFGLTGANDGLVDSTTPLPVEIFDVSGTMVADIGTIAGAVSGTEMQVDIVTFPSGNLGQQLSVASLSVTPATDIADATYIGDIRFGESLPAGTNAIGKLSENAGVNVGDVSVVSVIPGTGATNLGKAEDSVHVSGDTGVMAMGVRADTQGPLAANGDYTPFITNKLGSLWVLEESNFVDDTNSSTATLGAGATFTGTAIDILDFSAVTVNLDSDVDSATDGLQLQLSSDGTNWDVNRPFTYIASNDGKLFQVSAAAKFFRLLYTNGASPQGTMRLQTILHHTTPVSNSHRLVDTEDPDEFTILTKSAIVAQAGGTGDFVPVQSTNSGNLKVSIEESNGNITGGGTEATALRVTIASDSTGLLSIDDNGSSLTVDNGGTFTVQEDGAALTALQLIDDVVFTHDVAAGTAIGNMTMSQRDDEVGSTAVSSADGDAQALTSNKFGQLKTTEIADATSEIKYAIIDVASSGDNTIQAAAGVGIKIRVLSVLAIAAGTVNVRFESGASGTALTGQMNLVVNSGFSLPFNPGGWFETADNALLNLELSAAISVDGCISYVEV